MKKIGIVLISIILCVVLLLLYKRTIAVPKYIIKSGGSSFFIFSSEGQYYYITNIGTKIKAPDDSVIDSIEYSAYYENGAISKIMYNNSSEFEQNSEEYKKLVNDFNKIRHLLDEKYDVNDNGPKKYDFYTMYISKGHTYVSIVDYTKTVHKKVGSGRVSANPQVIYEYDGSQLTKIYISDFYGISDFGVL